MKNKDEKFYGPTTRTEFSMQNSNKSASCLFNITPSTKCLKIHKPHLNIY